MAALLAVAALLLAAGCAPCAPAMDPIGRLGREAAHRIDALDGLDALGAARGPALRAPLAGPGGRVDSGDEGGDMARNWHSA
ncbi:hypothetical protein NX801_15960 [Streptomyces sp. LP05-1]|uniref:Uncharacterized protein n=1 Tax=Streptomyces pyxinae TaxID=2970734 RepID=A0ABT2CI87_9ACTN|nr:hypothetical protein [Streptomyces sp. LP05-1]MCS0637128.1 hypothetical protein [Streptomyces sp. LP05-1]